MTQLTTPETSTIMLRRNSALANNKDGSSAATTPKSINSSFEAKNSPGAVGKKQMLVLTMIVVQFLITSIQQFSKISNTTRRDAETASKAQAIR